MGGPERGLRAGGGGMFINRAGVDLNMSQKLVARFDGQVLRPEKPTKLKVNGRYSLVAEELQVAQEESTETQKTPNPVFEYLLSVAENMGIPDLSAEHDHYLYGTPKRSKA